MMKKLPSFLFHLMDSHLLLVHLSASSSSVGRRRWGGGTPSLPFVLRKVLLLPECVSFNLILAHSLHFLINSLGRLSESENHLLKCGRAFILMVGNCHRKWAYSEENEGGKGSPSVRCRLKWSRNEFKMRKFAHFKLALKYFTRSDWQFRKVRLCARFTG